jgi:alkanesulfonate monooxygenase SsuD/methylene tetrahydromethanopterin reductase-like flavin-dependent oxidoreductase (luciferase family)
MMAKLGFPILMRHQMDIPELQGLLKEYEQERQKAGFPGPNNVTLQANCYLAETTEKARSEPEHSTMRERGIARRLQTGREGDAEAAVRLGQLRANQSYEDMLPRLLYGTPEEIVDRIQGYRETLGITGISLDINPGGQIPRDRVENSIRLLMERVAPHFN